MSIASDDRSITSRVNRNTQQILTLGVLFLCASALPVANATACTCMGGGSACVAGQRAAAVFVGRVTGFTSGVQFEVERSLSGAPVGSITVANGPGTCAFGFTVGDRYVVYAYRNQAGMLSTSICTRTRPLSDPHTRADIAYFNRRERNAAGGLLTGVVSDVTVDLSPTAPRGRPLSGIRITVSPEPGASPARTTTTRADGSYEVDGLPLGRIRVTASLPAQFEPPQPTVVAVDANGCAEADIAGQIDGQIRGQLIDEDGRPARSIAVQLADAAAARAGAVPLGTMNVLTDEEGTFEFHHVNVGRYVVGVELDRSVRPGKLNKRRFYPSSGSIETAADVTLGAAEHLQLPAFRLAALPSGRVITVVVHAPGVEIADATRLFLTGATREPIDRRGRPITLTLPFGAQFVIEATAPDGYKAIQPSKILIERDDTDRIVEFRIER